MKVTIELRAGEDLIGFRAITKADIDRNIGAITRVINGYPKLANDDVYLIDTRSILRAIRDRLLEEAR